MPIQFRALLSMATAVVVIGNVPGHLLATFASTTRTVYVTTLDGQGQPVRGLTAADFSVREGGQDREIVSVEPARARMRMALAIDEPLLVYSEARQGMANLIQRLAPQAEISLIAIGLGNRVMVPYSSDVATHMAALRGVSAARWGTPTNVPEGIDEIARQLDRDDPERPVMVVMAVDGQKEIAMPPENVLRSIRDSRTQMHVVAVSISGISGTPTQIIDGSGLTTILTEGPRRSGGRNIRVIAASALIGAMGQIATDLASQYAVTYTLPDGVKPAERLDVSLKRRGVTLRAPTRVPID
jgi:hypothetical protein